MTVTSRLVIEDYWKRFGGNQVLKGLSLSIENRSITGLVALNGAGKTTLVNLLFGVYPRDKGRAWFQGRELPSSPQAVVSSGLARTFQNARLPTNLTVTELLRGVLVGRRCSWRHYLLGRPVPASISGELEQLLSWFGLTGAADSIGGFLPFGLQRKVDIARAAATGARFLLLDEPAAGLSEAEEQDLGSCLRTLRDQQGFTFFVIDHRIDFLRQLVDRLVFLHDGRIELDSSSTGVDAVLRHPLLKLHYFGASDVGQDVNGESVGTGAAAGSAEDATVPMAVDGLCVERDGMPVVRSVSFTCPSATLSAIVGPNGAGKSSLLECMAGLIPPESGTIALDGLQTNPQRLSADHAVTLVPESTDVFPGLTVEENLRLGLSSGPRSGRRRALREVFKTYPKLGQYRAQSASILSGGERKMLALARAMLTRPRVLLVDEPSAGLAPAWIGRTYDTLRELTGGGVAALVTESQAGICEPYADRLASLHRGEITIQKPGIRPLKTTLKEEAL